MFGYGEIFPIFEIHLIALRKVEEQAELVSLMYIVCKFCKP